jgi:serine/threonine-protein kinase
LSEAVHIVGGVARALHPAHAAGIYHRDLTPDNVILIDQPKGGFGLRLIDFGVARHEYTSHGTLDGSIAGKPPYMSPEQCQGIAVDGRSDIYALGVMLYSLLNGSPPFTHTNPLEVMRMHKEEEVSYPAFMPNPVVQFLRRALAKNREERFPEILTVSQELQRIQQ